ncbi:Protein of unknown function DUF3425 [Aspergillus oryzae]|uniref:BZIP transcription factor n=3 Tax=Aspergillus oryzae TaxID=5062 RepID=A0A1S9DGP4_ASPOZ|nr:Protein of unknown function DUF3425 [Aspergillus oryzae]
MPPKRRSANAGRATCPSEEDNPASSTTTSNQSWKLKFNDRQLERKRQADRITQRRMREPSKQTAAAFKEKMELLMDGNHKALVERTLAENEDLVAKVKTFQAKFEQIYLASKECLGLDEGPGRVDTLVSGVTGLPGVPDPCLTSSGLEAPSGSNQDVPVVEQRSNLCRTFAEESGMSINRFTEAIMAWKYSMGLNNGLQLLVEHFKAQGYAAHDVLHERLLSSDFNERLLGLLVGDSDTGASLPCEKQTLLPLSPLDVVRRKTAYLAYRIVAPWQDCCRSHAEMIAIFWTQFRHLLLFIFPSSENFARCPCWYRPTPARLLHHHPGCLDFIMWPRLRERLSMTWKEHEMETLIRNLILGFKVRTAGFKPDQPLIRVKPNNNDLELTNEFEQALTDVSNFSMQANFIAQYPDLAPYIRADIRSFAPTLPPSVSLPRPTPSLPVGTQALEPDTLWPQPRLFSQSTMQHPPNPLYSSPYLYPTEGYRKEQTMVCPGSTVPIMGGNRDNQPLFTHSSLDSFSNTGNAETLDLSGLQSGDYFDPNLPRSLPSFNPPVVDNPRDPCTAGSLDLDSWDMFGGGDILQIPPSQ